MLHLCCLQSPRQQRLSDHMLQDLHGLIYWRISWFSDGTCSPSHSLISRQFKDNSAIIKNNLDAFTFFEICGDKGKPGIEPQNMYIICDGKPTKNAHSDTTYSWLKLLFPCIENHILVSHSAAKREDFVFPCCLFVTSNITEAKLAGKSWPLVWKIEFGNILWDSTSKSSTNYTWNGLSRNTRWRKHCSVFPCHKTTILNPEKRPVAFF